jgi:hypothetical protein
MREIRAGRYRVSGRTGLKMTRPLVVMVAEKGASGVTRPPNTS